MALTRGVGLHLYLDDQGLVSGGSTSEHSDIGRPDTVLRVDNQSREVQMFLFLGYEYHLDSALVKPTQERWLKLQDLILCLKSKQVLTTGCLMSQIGLLASMEKMVPGGTPTHEALSVSPQGALEISSVIGQPPSLISDLFSSPRVVAKSRKSL